MSRKGSYSSTAAMGAPGVADRCRSVVAVSFSVRSNQRGETSTFAEHVFGVKGKIELMFAPNA
jgi:hypothetical protein